MKNKTKSILYSILTFLNMAVLISLLILNNLSQSKMGVMRYLVYTRYNYPKTFFSKSLTAFYQGILVLIIAFIIFLIVKKVKTKNYNKPFIINSIIGIIFCLLGILIYHIPSLKEILIYYFLCIGLFLISTFEFLKLLIISKR